MIMSSFLSFLSTLRYSANEILNAQFILLDKYAFMIYDSYILAFGGKKTKFECTYYQKSEAAKSISKHLWNEQPPK